MTRALVLLLRFAAGTVALLAGAGWLGWLVGQVVTDRFLWSQWLHWIPTVLAIPLAVLVMIGLRLAWPPPRPGRAASGGHDPAGRSAGSRGAIRTGLRVLGWAMLVGTIARFAVQEHRLLARVPADPTGLKLLHWTIGEGNPHIYPDVADQVVGRDPAVAVLTDAARVTREPAVEAWVRDHGGRTILLRPFSVVTRLEVEFARQLVFPGRGRIGPALARVVLAAPSLPGGRLTLALVDLESDPLRPRHAIAEEAAALFREAWIGPPPDLVVGDFNMHRGSDSMERVVAALLPEPLRHAASEGGRGYQATWSAEVPLWHIDHAWLGPDVACVRYRTPIAAGWRHYPQVMWLAPRPAAGGG